MEKMEIHTKTIQGKQSIKKEG